MNGISQSGNNDGVTVPEQTSPNTSEPEDTVPQTGSDGEATVPEQTTPNTSVPEETVPQTDPVESPVQNTEPEVDAEADEPVSVPEADAEADETVAVPDETIGG